MKIGLCQLNATVGNLAGNCARIAEYAREAASAGCDLLVTPELAMTGYPPQDLLFKKHFVDDQLRALREQLAPGLPLPSIIGFVDRDEAGLLYNAAAYVMNGEIASVVHKTLLPTYDVFDELRYFKPAETNSPVELAGNLVGVTICEDIWDAGYKRKVVPGLIDAGATLLVNMSSSPFHAGKREVRLEVCRRHVLEHGVPLVYCNMVGAQDELIFDGESFGLDAAGKIAAIGNQFEEHLVCVSLDERSNNCEPEALAQRPAEGEIFDALCTGVRDYFQKCGFGRAVIGLSGGVDSALVACIASAALGPRQVMGVAMPSRHTSDMSNEDAEKLAANLGLDFRVMEIEQSVRLAMARFESEFGGYKQGITVENLQARERGKILMEISNDMNALVLSTGNKTEYALGYTTLYGDMCGGLAVIGDVSKPDVYAISRYYNELHGREMIPRRILDRPPTAELRAEQVDPFDYDRIGPLVDIVVEEHLSRRQLQEQGYLDEEVELVMRLVRINEYKRKQAPPVLRVTPKAFGIGRKMPIVNQYRE